MNFKVLFSISILWMAWANLFGQKLKNEFQLNLGGGDIARQDLIFSPFIHHDLSPINIGIRYQREGKFYQNASIRYASFTPVLANPYRFFDNDEVKTTSPHYFTMVDMDYWFGKEISAKGNFKTTLGITFNADIQAFNFVYGRFGNFGYYSTIGLGGFLRHSIAINERNAI